MDDEIVYNNSMSWFTKIVSGISGTDVQKKEVPEGLWSRCTSCGAVLYKPELSKNLNVCMKCEFHMPLGARARLEGFLDKGGLQEIGADVRPKDVLKFKDSKKYKDRLSMATDKAGENDALVVMQGSLNSIPITAAAFEFSFIGGSMGAIVGQKFVMGIEKAIEKRTPYICFAASGGARMQEGLVSLFQMGKTSMAIAKLGEEKLPLHSRAYQPNLWWRNCKFSHVGRYQYWRAQSRHWLCWQAGD